MSNESRKARALRQQNPGMASAGRVDPATGARARRASAGEQAAGVRYRQGLRVQDDGSLEVHTDGTLRVDQRQQLGLRNKFDTPTKGTEAANKDYVDGLTQALQDAIDDLNTFIVKPDAHKVTRKLTTQAITASHTALSHDVDSNDLTYDPDGLISIPGFGPTLVVGETCVEVGHAYAVTHTVNLSNTGGFAYTGGTVRIGWQYLHNDGSSVESTELPLSRSFVQYGTFASTDEGSVVVTSHAIIKPLGGVDSDGDPVYTLAPVYVSIAASSGGRFTVNNSHLHIRKLHPQQTSGSALPPPALSTSAPEAAFHAEPVSGALGRGFSTTFYDDSAGIGITSYAWDFGDSTTSTATNPSKTYTAAGTYTVSLTVTNSAGSDTETKTSYITVT